MSSLSKPRLQGLRLPNPNCARTEPLPLPLWSQSTWLYKRCLTLIWSAPSDHQSVHTTAAKLLAVTDELNSVPETPSPVGAPNNRNTGVDHGQPQARRHSSLSHQLIKRFRFPRQRDDLLSKQPRYTRRDLDSQVIKSKGKGGASVSEISSQHRSSAFRTRPPPPRPETRTRPPTPPSEILIAALGPVGHHYETPKRYQNKLNLSYHDPMVVSKYGRTKSRPMSGEVQNVDESARNARNGLQSLLAQYIRFTDHCEERALYGHVESKAPDYQNNQLSQNFDSESLRLLSKQGYGLQDVVSWAWILKAQSAELAATRLWALTNCPNLIQPRSIPMSLYLFLLRRQDWSAAGVKLMLSYAWLRMGGRDALSQTHNAAKAVVWPRERWGKPGTKEVALSQPREVMIAFIRLLRHARKVFPEACISIAALLSKHLTSRSRQTKHDISSGHERARLTFLYNTALSLLSHPSSVRPYQLITHQQRAQFNLIRTMSEFDPPLAIDREGYRAVTRVQLAHRKTMQEADWAAMKAKSWPPWKEDRHGLDVNKGPEYGQSRASEVISKMEEAGYAKDTWEDSARVLAGWDTDESPTIQTRALLSKPLMSRRVGVSGGTLVINERTSIWAARIRATRTVDEAWACFLAFENNRAPKTQDVYYAMFEKLVFEQKRLKLISKDGSQGADASFAGDNEAVLPGDSPRVYEKPSSQDAIYVPTSPLDLDAFFDLMLKHGIRPSGRFLAFLLKHARTFKSGIRYLRASALPPRVADALLSDKTLDRQRVIQDIGYMSDHNFAAFIHFLTRFAPRQSDEQLPSLSYRMSCLGGKSAVHSQRIIDPLHQAFRLLLTRKPFYRPPWNSTLSALARSGTSVAKHGNLDDPSSLSHANWLPRDTDGFGNRKALNSNKTGIAQDIRSWTMIRNVLRQMDEIGLELDFAGFQIVCVGLEKAIFAATTGVAVLSDVESGDSLHMGAMEVLKNGHVFVKSLFKRLVFSGHSAVDSAHAAESSQTVPATVELLPRLLEVPAPSHLHAFIRVLGLREDFQGMQELIEWMSRFAPELQAVAEEAANGQRMLRRCLVAARVFLEQSWVTVGQRTRDDEGFPEREQTQRREQTERPNGMQQQDSVSECCPTEILDCICDRVGQTEQWGGWPTDEEVEAYCRRKRR